MNIYIVVFCLLISSFSVWAQRHEVRKGSTGSIPYESLSNDPLGVRIYTLANGLKVYISVNSNEPRVQTYIAVRAGSKHDPADATGLAHYLEHMLFKGTDTYGTLDFSKEQPLIQKIEDLYELYRATSDSAKRVALYKSIDSLSGIAATFAIPNEYDKMVNSMGAKGTNAHTSVEETVYENDIPSNQLKKWLTLEAERFRNPVLRLFHTELEAVYEEKNRTLDNDARIANEVRNEELFKKHPYGTQTTIGTIEHLKSPSMKRIREYYAKYYVPNNMAIILCGDVDPDQTIEWINETFGKFKSKPVPDFTFSQEEPIAKPRVREVSGPSPEGVQLCFRFPGSKHPDTRLLIMTDMILSNSAVGLIDLNINQAQKALQAGSSPQTMSDYSVHSFFGRPRQGQKSEDVVALLLEQIEKVKRGEFSESILPSIVQDMNINNMKQYESNEGRANACLEAFIEGWNWKDFIEFDESLAQITKQQVIEFAKKHYTNNYVVIYKRNGAMQNVPKVAKPAITPVAVNRDVQSEFLKTITTTPASVLVPRFVDFANDITTTKLSTSVPVQYVHNKENKLFKLDLILDMSSNDEKKLALALSYMNFLGTATKSNEDIKNKLYELGCTITPKAGADDMRISISGLDANLPAVLSLLEEQLASSKPDTDALQGLISNVLKQRTDAKKNKGVILQQALSNYVKYGARNPFTDVLSEKELKEITAQELVDKLRDFNQYEHRITYYGPRQLTDVMDVLQRTHKIPSSVKAKPSREPYVFQDNTEGGVFFVEFPMVQAEVIQLRKAESGYNVAKSPFTRMFNDYFGGGMSGVVFQTMRESKALAYSVDSWVLSPRKKTDPYYVQSYIGTQSDKLIEAINGMNELLNTMPRTQKLFDRAKESIINRIQSERFTKDALFSFYDNMTRVGLEYDVRMEPYSKIPSMTLDEFESFHASMCKNKKFAYLIIGSKSKLNLEQLKTFGTVRELTLQEIFGY